jgi:hypothetical protein
MTEGTAGPFLHAGDQAAIADAPLDGLDPALLQHLEAALDQDGIEGAEELVRQTQAAEGADLLAYETDGAGDESEAMAEGNSNALRAAQASRAAGFPVFCRAPRSPRSPAPCFADTAVGR